MESKCLLSANMSVGIPRCDDDNAALQYCSQEGILDRVSNPGQALKTSS